MTNLTFLISPRTNHSLLAHGHESTSEPAKSPCLWEHCGGTPTLQLRIESKALGYAVTCLRFNQCLTVGAGQARRVIYLHGCHAAQEGTRHPTSAPRYSGP